MKEHPKLQFYEGEQLLLLLKKGVYPYEYANSAVRFNETELPPQEAFYSHLNRVGIPDEEYTISMVSIQLQDIQRLP